MHILHDIVTSFEVQKGVHIEVTVSHKEASAKDLPVGFHAVSWCRFCRWGRKKIVFKDNTDETPINAADSI